VRVNVDDGGAAATKSDATARDRGGLAASTASVRRCPLAAAPTTTPAKFLTKSLRVGISSPQRDGDTGWNFRSPSTDVDDDVRLAGGVVDSIRANGG
jgi:hypothetical protein